MGEGLVAVVRNAAGTGTLRVLTIDRLGEPFTQRVLKLGFTPRKLLVDEAMKLIITVEADQAIDSYPQRADLQVGQLRLHVARHVPVATWFWIARTYNCFSGVCLGVAVFVCSRALKQSFLTNPVTSHQRHQYVRPDCGVDRRCERSFSLSPGCLTALTNGRSGERTGCVMARFACGDCMPGMIPANHGCRGMLQP